MSTNYSSKLKIFAHFNQGYVNFQIKKYSVIKFLPLPCYKTLSVSSSEFYYKGTKMTYKLSIGFLSAFRKVKIIACSQQTVHYESAMPDTYCLWLKVLLLGFHRESSDCLFLATIVAITEIVTGHGQFSCHPLLSAQVIILQEIPFLLAPMPFTYFWSTFFFFLFQVQLLQKSQNHILFLYKCENKDLED